MLDKTRVIVELVGGMVRDVYSTQPDIEVMVIEYDTDVPAGENPKRLPQPPYVGEDAHVEVYTPGDPGEFDARWTAADEAMQVPKKEQK